MKSKFIALAGTLGGLCALCCTLPIFGFLGFGALEALFCENKALQYMGIAIAFTAVILLAQKYLAQRKNQSTSCALSCNCKNS